jgi:hypothetical protein
MTPMHMSMSDAWSEEEGVQQWFPSQEGGLRLIQFESPRWRPKATQVRAQLGVQEQHALKMTPQLHTESVLDGLYMGGTGISYTFQWHWFQAQIRSESTGIVEKSRRPESAKLLRHQFVGRLAQVVGAPPLVALNPRTPLLSYTQQPPP